MARAALNAGVTQLLDAWRSCGQAPNGYSVFRRLATPAAVDTSSTVPNAGRREVVSGSFECSGRCQGRKRVVVIKPRR